MSRPAVLTLLLLLAACSRAPGLERLAAGEQGRVTEVRSGDTLVLDSGLVVRLAGVEAPKGALPYADQARDGARQALALGKRVQLLYGGARRDRYGRALAQVRVAHGAWLEQVLLRAGDVRERTWSDNRAMAAAMLEAEAYARNRRRGLWGLADYRVLIPAEAFGADGFQVLEGRLRRVDPDRDGAVLVFDNGFSAWIDQRALGDFQTAGKAPGVLVGKPLRIRGVIRYGQAGPQMRLDHPEEVEILKLQG